MHRHAFNQTFGFSALLTSLSTQLHDSVEDQYWLTILADALLPGSPPLCQRILPSSGGFYLLLSVGKKTDCTPFLRIHELHQGAHAILDQLNGGMMILNILNMCGGKPQAL